MKLTPTNLPALIDWATEAATVFANGVLSGVGGGTFAGAGTGAVSAQSAGGLDAKGLSVALFAAGLAALGNGAKRLVVWHDSHPIPNPFAKTVTANPPAQ